MFGDGFAAGEAYRNKQTTLRLDDHPLVSPCVFNDAERHTCGIYAVACTGDDPSKGCYISEETRNKILVTNSTIPTISLPAKGVLLKRDWVLLNSIPIPVRVHFMASDYTNDHLYFRCQGYRPYGGDPNYHEKNSKYHNNSDACVECFKVINGVPYRAPFRCRKDRHGSEYHAYTDLPTKYSPKHEIRDITAGMKFLFPQEKKVKR